MGIPLSLMMMLKELDQFGCKHMHRLAFNHSRFILRRGFYRFFFLVLFLHVYVSELCKREVGSIKLKQVWDTKVALDSFMIVGSVLHVLIMLKSRKSNFLIMFNSDFELCLYGELDSMVDWCFMFNSSFFLLLLYYISIFHFPTFTMCLLSEPINARVSCLCRM